MKTLMLPVKRKWFEQIKSGMKKVEYRLVTEYWKNRLIDKKYDRIVITLGYPKKEDSSRRITFPYRGYEKTTIRHHEWDYLPMRCFALLLEARK